MLPKFDDGSDDVVSVKLRVDNHHVSLSRCPSMLDSQMSDELP